MLMLELSMKRFLVACLAFAALSGAAFAADPDNTVYLELKSGRVTIELRPDLAPKHVERFKQLIKEDFYDGLTFHRVITGFMAQTGDPLGDGTGGSSYPDLPAEFTNAESFGRGTLGMARSAAPDSANSQFFIVFEAAPHLDGGYTIFGKVIEGMELVDQIKKGEGANGEVSEPDTIVKMELASEAG
jgi:peptidylprolyl isomerase